MTEQTLPPPAQAAAIEARLATAQTLTDSLMAFAENAERLLDAMSGINNGEVGLREDYRNLIEQLKTSLENSLENLVGLITSKQSELLILLEGLKNL
jgi:hypothetical protein